MTIIITTSGETFRVTGYFYAMEIIDDLLRDNIKFSVEYQFKG